MDLAALGVAGDARLETGDIAGARERYLTAGGARPLARVMEPHGPARLPDRRSRARRATGRPAPPSVIAARTGAPDAEAFYEFQLGDLHRATGDLVAALRPPTPHPSSALPEYVPAMDGLGRGPEARDRARDEAIRLLERATARLPQPELVAALGDLYALDGQRDAGRRRSTRLVDGIARLSAATGSVYDRQLVIFSRRPRARPAQCPVARARAELAVRGDIYGHDALAWVLYRARQIRRGRRPRRGGTGARARPIPRIAYHAGLIAAARGETRRAAEPAADSRATAWRSLPPLQADAARARWRSSSRRRPGS